MPAKPKKTNFDLIPEVRDDGKEEPLYRTLRDLMGADFPDLAECRILLAWKSWEEDKDGRVTLGQATRASERERTLHPDPYDCVICLNRELFPELTMIQQEAILHHELNHYGVDIEDGQVRRDDKGRIVVRSRDHDLSEFRSTVEKYGVYRQDVEAFAKSLARSKDAPLLASLADPARDDDAGEYPRAAEVG
jgi:hypothetical protein